MEVEEGLEGSLLAEGAPLTFLVVNFIPFEETLSLSLLFSLSLSRIKKLTGGGGIGGASLPSPAIVIRN